jgi:hypothetical protein
MDLCFLGATGAILGAILTLTLMLALALKPITRHLPAECLTRIGRASVLPAVAGIGTGLLVGALHLPAWLAACATLLAFALASFASGLVGMAQWRSFSR